MPPARVGLVLGVDPGLASTGYGLLAEDNQVVACGTIKTAPGPTAPRLHRIVSELAALLAAFPVREAALEELFMGRNTTSAIAVAQARGAILAALEGAGVPSFEYKPAQVKAMLTGYGMAGKAQMARMLGAQLAVAGGLDDHATDAIAIALCHSRSRRFRAAAAVRQP